MSVYCKHKAKPSSPWMTFRELRHIRLLPAGCFWRGSDLQIHLPPCGDNVVKDTFSVSFSTPENKNAPVKIMSFCYQFITFAGINIPVTHFIEQQSFNPQTLAIFVTTARSARFPARQSKVYDALGWILSIWYTFSKAFYMRNSTRADEI